MGACVSVRGGASKLKRRTSGEETIKTGYHRSRANQLGEGITHQDGNARRCPVHHREPGRDRTARSLRGIRWPSESKEEVRPRSGGPRVSVSKSGAGDENARRTRHPAEGVVRVKPGGRGRQRVRNASGPGVYVRSGRGGPRREAGYMRVYHEMLEKPRPHQLELAMGDRRTHTISSN
jgi:hypothetical protein